MGSKYDKVFPLTDGETNIAFLPCTKYGVACDCMVVKEHIPIFRNS